jgi:gliding motility-associated-like protein
VYRSDPSTPQFNLSSTRQASFTDDKLNPAEGVFNYEVLALESFVQGNTYYAGQSRSNNIRLIQEPIVRLPNAFTSNGDGLNEHFGWLHLFVKDFTIRIYDRWGEQVYCSGDKYGSWDGRYKGEPCQPDVYFYKLSYTGWEGTEKFAAGTFTLLR